MELMFSKQGGSGCWVLEILCSNDNITTCSATTAALMCWTIVDLRYCGIDALIMTVCREWAGCRTSQLLTVVQKCLMHVDWPFGVIHVAAIHLEKSRT